VATLRRIHQQLIMPNNGVLAIYGDVQTSRVVAEVEKYFGTWKNGSPPAMPTFLNPSGGRQRVRETRDKKQAVLVIGFPGVKLDNKDRFALELIQEACSDLGSRLFLQIRDKLGLAYYVGAHHMTGISPGFFSFHAGTSPDKVEIVEQQMLHEAEMLRSDGLTAEELQRAKAKLNGQRKIARQDLGSMAMTNALDELYGLGYGNSDTEDAEFDAVTAVEVKAAANKYFQLDGAVTATIIPANPS
jgi:zinc protease